MHCDSLSAAWRGSAYKWPYWSFMKLEFIVFDGTWLWIRTAPRFSWLLLVVFVLLFKAVCDCRSEVQCTNLNNSGATVDDNKPVGIGNSNSSTNNIIQLTGPNTSQNIDPLQQAYAGLQQFAGIDATFDWSFYIHSNLSRIMSAVLDFEATQFCLFNVDFLPYPRGLQKDTWDQCISRLSQSALFLQFLLETVFEHHISYSLSAFNQLYDLHIGLFSASSNSANRNC